jgi:protein-S-isoprenylcysteine O-methyltransferase Ste14
MSNNSEMLKKLARWAAVNVAVGGGLFAISGLWQDPWMWAYVMTFSVPCLYAMLSIDEDLARERFHPPEASADRLPLQAIRLFALAHLIIGALDAGRWHVSHVPDAVRIVGLIGMLIAFMLFFRAMVANRFFSAVVRIQRDRGHRVVDQGPYAVVRHPGYAGMILAMPFSALALGSWLSLATALVLSAMTFRRVLFEDAFLRANLEGYAAYAGRVRYRLIPGVW